MRIIVISFLTILTGCATVPDVPTEVRVPVPVACVTQDQVPRATFPMDADLAKLPDGPLVYALAKDRLERQAHIGKLEAVLQGCVR